MFKVRELLWIDVCFYDFMLQGVWFPNLQTYLAILQWLTVSLLWKLWNEFEDLDSQGYLCFSIRWTWHLRHHKMDTMYFTSFFLFQTRKSQHCSLKQVEQLNILTAILYHYLVILNCKGLFYTIYSNIICFISVN